MSSKAIQPSTLDGIKRLAKLLKVERDIKHVRALDDAAQAAGFQNFRHACNVLRSTATKAEQARPSYCTFLTSYWKDPKSGRNGREMLTIWLSAPWSELITRPQLQNHRALVNFRPEGPDHLTRAQLLRSQSEAQSTVCAAARVLHFMDATKLRPSKSHSRAFPSGSSNNAIPGRDHYNVWYDRESRRYLITDEPYEKAVENKLQEREDWAKRWNFGIVKPEWEGMYAPDIGSRLYLLADNTKGIPLQPIATALNKLPAPLVETEWKGESTPTLASFVSPGTLAKKTSVNDQTKTQPKSNGQRNSISYIQTFVGPQRRPNGKMPIEIHAEIGQLLKSVLVATRHRSGVYNRINKARCELDEWVQREYNRNELPDQQFFDLYYHESGSTFSRSLPQSDREHHIESLAKAKTILEKHYPDCPPLRRLLSTLDAATKSLSNWK